MIQSAAAAAAVFVDFLDGDFVIFKTGLIVGLFNSSFQSCYKTNCDMFLCGATLEKKTLWNSTKHLHGRTPFSIHLMLS